MTAPTDITFALDTLQGPRVVLRPLTVADAEPLARLANNRAIWRNLTDRFPHPYAVSDAEAFIQRNVEKPGHNLAITVDGAFAGVIGLIANEDVRRFTAELGYWLGEPFWGKGYATEAARLMVAAAFELGVHRLIAHTYAWNSASAHVLEKAGFAKEAVHRDAAYKDGAFVDEHLFVQLAPA